MRARSESPYPNAFRPGSNSLFGFFGRETEIERLIDAVKKAPESNHSTMFLCGEPGIGKTSLCTEVTRATHELGIPVLYGRCDEDLVVSYQPFAEALSYLVVHASDSLLKSTLPTAEDRS